MEPKRTVFSSPHLLTDDDIRALGVREADLEIYRRKHYQAQFGIDTWYEALKEHTFKTSTSPLTFEEAKAIIDHHLHKEGKETEEILQKLQSRLDELIKRDFPNGAFIKLNTRSPKDVPVYDFENEKIRQLIHQEMETVPVWKKNSKSRTDELIQIENQQTIAFVIATTKYMRVRSGKKAMKILLKSTRIMEDLTRFIAFGKDLFDINIILREWMDQVPSRPEGEFRAFVHKNELNAITQYYSFCFFNELVQQQEELKQRMFDFWKSIQSSLASHESYVIDFFVMPDRVLIIELNPFHNGAGAGLFSWRDDRELMMNGPLELRVLKTPEPLPLNPLPLYWQKYIIRTFGGDPSQVEGGVELQTKKKKKTEKDQDDESPSFLSSLFNKLRKK